ncbi:MAG TPA: divalent metal cation transporter, partial [Bacteroidales bacterium]|nr:divalent metal cation transporter [Bacteroidales bacterium]
IVMEGFLNLRLRPWVRRLLTRMVAIVPAVIVAALYGERGVGNLLVFSQVILSLQLSFAVVPLVVFTGNRLKMGKFVNSAWLRLTSWIIAILIIILNAFLLIQFIAQW